MFFLTEKSNIVLDFARPQVLSLVEGCSILLSASVVSVSQSAALAEVEENMTLHNYVIG